MALVTVFVFTFYAVIQANSKSVKIAENTFVKAKRQQYTLDMPGDQRHNLKDLTNEEQERSTGIPTQRKWETGVL
ncbi:unnamed protein product [Porites evermanni]|uniref:Secreted protein n=1 Tax=Porites evermanni TaxID=104178 RepID=A0ABN8MDN5_9CNID|nr:unnamed protein product [Porites evermanni]